MTNVEQSREAAEVEDDVEQPEDDDEPDEWWVSRVYGDRVAS